MSATSPEEEQKRLETLDRAGRQAYQWLLFGSATYIILICTLARPWLWELDTASNLGDFLAGLFAPPAFAALAVALYVQRIELRQNTKALMQQADETAALVKEAQLQSRSLDREFHLRSIELKISLEKRLLEQLANVCYYFLKNARGSSPLYTETLWESFSKGNHLAPLVGFESHLARIKQNYKYLKDDYGRYIVSNYEIEAFEATQLFLSVIKNFEQEYSQTLPLYITHSETYRQIIKHIDYLESLVDNAGNFNRDG